MEIILSAGLCVLIVLCLVEISSMQLAAFREEMRLKVNQ